MHRAHRIRLNPTPEQAAYFRKAAGSARFVFNWGLAEVKRALDEGRKPESVVELKKRFNALKGEQFPWVYEVTKCVVEGAFRHLGKALTNFWQSQRGERMGNRVRFPHFKSKRRGPGSFVLNNDKFRVEDHTLVVPKLGGVNVTEVLRFAGKILSAVISEHAGWWWVSVQVELPDVPAVPAGHALGVDVGVKDLAVDSDGQRYATRKRVPRAPLRSALRRVKRLQRAVSRRQKGSSNRRKAVRRLARAHHRVACQRADAAHKLTTALVRKAGVLGIEQLHVAGLLANHHLALALSDAALSAIHRQLRYKAASAGVQVVAVDRFYPSSQIHHACGYRHRDLTLAERTWRCPHCGLVVDRDYNAAKNIRDEALRICGVLGSGYLGTENWPVEGVSDCRPAAVLDEAGTTADLRVSAGTIG
jgi:putative transposase